MELVEVLHSVQGLGRFCGCSPSRSLKVWHFKHWNIHVTYVPIPSSYSIGFGFDWSPSWPEFDCFLAVSLFWLPPCLLGLGPLLLTLWLVCLWPQLGPCHWFFGAHWAPSTAAINYCCTSTHFPQGSHVGASGTGLVSPFWPDGTSLTTPDLEAQELLCFSCLSLHSAFLAAHITAMSSFIELWNLAWIAPQRGFLRQ